MSCPRGGVGYCALSGAEGPCGGVPRVSACGHDGWVCVGTVQWLGHVELWFVGWVVICVVIRI